MPDDSAQVKLNADIGDLKSGMDQANDAVATALNNMAKALEGLAAKSDAASKEFKKSHEEMGLSAKALAEKVGAGYEKVTGFFEKLQTGMLAFAGLLAGGALFKDIIESTTRWGEEVGSLSHSLGITTEEASKLNAGLRITGNTSEQYITMLQRLSMRLRENEPAMNALGMATRDASGQLVSGQEAIQNALEAIQKYKAGTDQMAVSTFLLGRGAGDLTRVLLLNRQEMTHAGEVAKSLGLVMSTDGVEATHQYQMAINEFKLEITALWKQIGTELMRALKELADWLNEKGPEAARAMIGALKGLAEAFNYTVAMAEKFAAIGAVLKSPTYENVEALHGQLKKINDDLDSANAKLEMLFAKSAAKPPAPSEEKKTGEVFMPGGGQTLSKDQLAAMRGRGAGGKGGAGEDPTDVLNKQLEEMLLEYQNWDKNASAISAQFWEDQLQHTQAGSEQSKQIWASLMAAQKQLYTEGIAQAQQAAKDSAAESRNATEMQKSDSDTAIKLQKQKLDTLYTLGQISASERLALENQFDNQQYQQELNAAYKHLDLVMQESDASKEVISKAWLDIEKLQNQHALVMAKNEEQALDTMKKDWDRYTTEVGNAITGLLFKHQTFAKTVQQLEERLASKLIDLGLKQVEGWLLTELRKTTATQAGATARAGAEATGTSMGIIAQAAAALKSIATSAAQTFAGIFGFLSPVMGPAAIGPAAGGEAVVLSVQGMVASAAYGYDIGSESPLIQAHAREMVLPAPLAEGVRQMTDQGGGGRRGGDTHMHINATDAHSFEKQLARSNSMLNRVMKRAIRDGNFPLRR